MGMQLNTAQWKSKSREMVSCENANGIHNFATTVNNTHTQLELVARTNAGTEPAARARRAVRQGAGAWAIAAGREGVPDAIP